MSKTEVHYDFCEEIKMPKSLRFREDMKCGEKMFYAELLGLSEKGKLHFHPGSLAKAFKVSTLTIYNWCKNLTNLGLLEISIDINDPLCKQFIKMKS